MLFRHSTEKRRHLAGLGRAFAYFAFLGVVCAGLTVRNARAEVGDRSIILGRQMLELANGNHNDITKVSLNGQPMFVGSSLAKDGVRAVLDRYESHCKTNAAQSTESWRELGKGAEGSPQKTDGTPGPGDNTGFFTGGLMRSGTDQEGTVICFVRSDDSKGTAKEAIKTFADTGELGALGQLRYVYVKKTQHGNTHVLTAWTTSKFNLREIMATEGKDVPGNDFAEIPRIPGSQRVLSTQVEGTAFGVNVYRTEMGQDQVIKLYDEEMIKKGWFALDAELKNPDNAKAHLYEKDGVVLTLATNVHAGATFAGLGLAGVQPTDKFQRR